jgi:transcriptional repressor NrdR
VPELTLPMVIKSDQSREPFAESKLRHGMEMALEKRPVSTEAIDHVVSKIFHRVRTMGEREISSQTIGELVMDELRELDQVAYVRFASIYRSFEDVNAFREVIKRLEKESKSKESND